ncbi:UDP-4-amino-4,6-dideoxy-N-acetyl-beta-L-altrosamine N-acetyltransferase [Ruminococcus sp.]|jgi:UDP-4-amino-4,6-dideoxy-N-acetyl-beta-L-altrosamine N-acetyltransferase|uniref:UDP-4-amino-4, 6-dideoxy-N-acetyl-beta-L-altrosamine N-acetyltransferase n=1 Tax=Ruminococcus sp. TaxID=41978 RepID=UPI0025DC925D|nr:UDP-4-amino-4,6-dideoxy-N-acetyl-beta-L-altrosamine N-acetyltransferase [Ruminococcus sp.]
MNVIMTRLQESDLEMVMDWRMRPYITKFMNTDPILTLDKQKKWFESIKDRDNQINWIIRFDDRPIGLINVFDIDRINSRCSWGYYIAEKDARSLQLALYLEWSLYDYVFDVLKLHKLCNETFADNKQVIKLHIMCGGKEDGLMRQHICKNGIYHDISVGSIIAEEWFVKRKNTKYESFQFE